MKYVKLLGNYEARDAFFNIAGLTDFGPTVYFGTEIAKPSIVVNLEDDDWCCYASLLPRQIDHSTSQQVDNPTMALMRQRYQDWKAGGFEGADVGIQPLLETVNQSKLFQTAWSCTGHADRTDADGCPEDGYLVLVADEQHLLRLAELVMKKTDGALHSETGIITVELGRLQHHYNSELTAVLLYQGIIFRWYARTPEHLGEWYGRAVKFITDCINEYEQSVL